VDWSPEHIKSHGILAFVQRMVALRKAHPVLRQRRFLTGRPVENDFPDVVWLTPQGQPSTPEDWNFPEARCLAYLLNGRRPSVTESDNVGGASAHLLFFLNALHEDFTFNAPADYDMRWKPMVDTAFDDGKPKTDDLAKGDPYVVMSRSLVILASY
jgi:isoamylase